MINTDIRWTSELNNIDIEAVCALSALLYAHGEQEDASLEVVDRIEVSRNYKVLLQKNCFRRPYYF